MKKALMLLIAATLTAGAQQNPQNLPASIGTNLPTTVRGPNYSDVYCAGFLRKQMVSHDHMVAGGMHSPNATQFAEGDTIFLRGAGLQEGAVLSVVRELEDPNKNEAFQGQHSAVKKTGQPYADLGRVRVMAIRGETAVAKVEFSCMPMVAGDFAVPFEERAMAAFPVAVPFERYPSAATGPVGQIVLAKEFDTVVGTGRKIYLDLGSDGGVKAGDTFRIVRFYDPLAMEELDRLSYRPYTSEDTQFKQKRFGEDEYNKLPRRAVGQAVVLMVNPGSSTAIITLALEDVLVGDQVELLTGASAAAK